MKCINEELIQKYIDGETTREEKELIETHIAGCEECARQLNEQKEFISFFRENMSQLGNVPAGIPDFVKPGKKQFILKSYIVEIAAACILASFFFINPKEKNEPEYFMFYGMEDSFDANKTFSQQEVNLFIIDDNGNIIEF